MPSGIRPLPWVERIASAQVGLCRQAELAVAALGCVERDQVVTGFEPGHTRTYLHHRTLTRAGQGNLFDRQRGAGPSGDGGFGRQASSNFSKAVMNIAATSKLVWSVIS